MVGWRGRGICGKRGIGIWGLKGLRRKKGNDEGLPQSRRERRES